MERSQNTARLTRSAVHGPCAFSVLAALAVAASVLVGAGDAAAQGAQVTAPEIPLLEAVTGDFSRPIDTDSPLAQARKDAGVVRPP